MALARAEFERGLRTAVAGSMAAKTVEIVTLVLLATVVPRALGLGRTVVGGTAAAVTSVCMLPRAAGPTLAAMSFAGAAGVLALSFT